MKLKFRTQTRIDCGSDGCPRRAKAPHVQRDVHDALPDDTCFPRHLLPPGRGYCSRPQVGRCLCSAADDDFVSVNTSLDMPNHLRDSPRRLLHFVLTTGRETHLFFTA